MDSKIVMNTKVTVYEADNAQVDSDSESEETPSNGNRYRIEFDNGFEIHIVFVEADSLPWDDILIAIKDKKDYECERYRTSIRMKDGIVILNEFGYDPETAAIAPATACIDAFTRLRNARNML